MFSVRRRQDANLHLWCQSKHVLSTPIIFSDLPPRGIDAFHAKISRQVFKHTTHASFVLMRTVLILQFMTKYFTRGESGCCILGSIRL